MDDQTNEPVDQERYVEVGKAKVFLNPEHLQFNEANLSKFLQEGAGWYNYYGQQLADAEGILQLVEYRFDQAYARAFAQCKESGETEKLADSHARLNPEVEKARLVVIKAKRAAKKLSQFLRAFDKATENAHQFGFNLRKEWDKIRPKVPGQDLLDDAINDVIKAADVG